MRAPRADLARGGALWRTGVPHERGNLVSAAL